MDLEYSHEWFEFTREMNALDRRLYNEKMDHDTEETIRSEYRTCLYKRYEHRSEFIGERKKELVEDMEELTGTHLEFHLQYQPTQYVTVRCPKDKLAFDVVDEVRVSPAAKRHFESQGYDVAILAKSSSSRGMVRIADIYGELRGADAEGHEATHLILDGTPLQNAYHQDEARIICDTACDIVGAERLQYYVEKHYSSDEKMVERMDHLLHFKENSVKLIGEARDEILPFIEAGDKKGADAVVDKYSALSDEVLGQHLEINRCIMAVAHIYSGNKEVKGALETLKDERGVAGMLEAVKEITTIDELLDVAYDDQGIAKREEPES